MLLAIFVGTLPARALTFNLTFDSSVTSLANAAQVEAAVSNATQVFQNLYTNAMTVNLTVSFSSSVNLGESRISTNGSSDLPRFGQRPERHGHNRRGQ